MSFKLVAITLRCDCKPTCVSCFGSTYWELRLAAPPPLNVENVSFAQGLSPQVGKGRERDESPA